MLRSVLVRGASVARTASKCKTFKPVSVVSTQKAFFSRFAEDSGDSTTDFLNMLNKPDIDSYDLRCVVQYMNGLDYIPDSQVIEAIIRACRRTNDYALTTRCLEAIRYKCGNDEKLYTQLLAPLKSTFDELGILTPEQMGYDKPEMYTDDVFDIH